MKNHAKQRLLSTKEYISSNNACVTRGQEKLFLHSEFLNTVGKTSGNLLSQTSKIVIRTDGRIAE